MIKENTPGPDYSFLTSPKMPSIYFIFPFDYKNNHISYQYEVNTGFLQVVLDTVQLTNFVQHVIADGGLILSPFCG